MSSYVRLAVMVKCCLCYREANASASFECPSNPENITLPEGWDWQRFDMYDQDCNPRCDGCVAVENAQTREFERQDAERRAAAKAKREAKKAAKAKAN